MTSQYHPSPELEQDRNRAEATPHRPEAESKRPRTNPKQNRSASFGTYLWPGQRLIENFSISTPPRRGLALPSCAGDLAENICHRFRFPKKWPRCRSQPRHVRFSKPMATTSLSRLVFRVQSRTFAATHILEKTSAGATASLHMFDFVSLWQGPHFSTLGPKLDRGFLSPHPFLKKRKHDPPLGLTS